MIAAKEHLNRVQQADPQQQAQARARTEAMRATINAKKILPMEQN